MKNTIAIILGMAFLAASAGATIIDTINAMPDNTWLRLPNNGAQPITRSGSNPMHYDGDSVGYLWGTCHAGYHNDLWAFNLSANQWREAQATEPSVTADPLVIQNKDSILMTREERPLSFHQWSSFDFDTDQKKLWHTTYAGWQGLYSGHDSVVCQYRPGPNCNVHTSNRVMAQYDPAANKWAPVKFPAFSWPLTCSTCGPISMVFRYIPYLKKFVCMVWDYYPDTYVMMDPVNRTLSTARATLQPLAGDGAAGGSGMLGGAVWDSYREVLIFAGRGNTGTWAFDPKAMAMKQIVTKAGSPCVWTDCNTSHMVYDSGNRCALVYTTPGMQTCYGGGTWPARSAVYVLDYEGGKWDLLPAPSSGQAPANTGANSTHGYFDQKLGVIFHYEGGYCASGGVRWIYKYKKPSAGLESRLPSMAAAGLTASPNPFRISTTIHVNGTSAVKNLKIFNSRGSLVGGLTAGKDNAFEWRPGNLPAGVYLVRAESGAGAFVKKIALIK